MVCISGENNIKTLCMILMRGSLSCGLGDSRCAFIAQSVEHSAVMSYRVILVCIWRYRKVNGSNPFESVGCGCSGLLVFVT